MQGMEARFSLIRMTQASDDQVGGSVLTGTVTNTNLRGHLHVSLPDQRLLQQGLETTKTADAFVWPASISIYERDVLEVTGPVNHPELNNRFRVEGVQRPSNHPHRKQRFVKVRMQRIDRTSTEAKI